MMIAKIIMKNPILMIGILTMTIFLFNLKDKNIFDGRTKKLQAVSCVSALVMLNKRIPDSWSTKCKKENLLVSIDLSDKFPQKPNNHKLKQFIYRELANNLVFIAKNCLNESLERVPFVTVKQNNRYLSVIALTKGKNIAKFATLKSQKFIGEQLQRTVTVKEIQTTSK